ncbi:hypothetical protein BT69DRAFT_1246136 [Atractiella rhizophila]|nr:hypothetical protein BT69DRAFT_1246136 [Atractiella rhizophila]
MKDDYIGEEFYSIEAILSENQKIPTTFNLTVPNLGFLEGDGSDSRDIQKGVTLALPFWIGDYLSTHPSYDWVSLSLPKQFGPRIRQALKADAKSVNLRNLNGGAGISGAGYWYEMGLRMDNVIHDDTLRETLADAFQKRFLEITINHNTHPPQVQVEAAARQSLPWASRRPQNSSWAWRNGKGNCSFLVSNRRES